MVTNELDITIDRPIQEVFAYVSAPQHAAEWQIGLVEIMQISEGPLGVGSQLTDVRNFMGRRLESLLQLTNFNQDRMFAYKTISGLSPWKQSFLFETTRAGTRVTTAIELEPSGELGLSEPLIASGLKRDMLTDFANLKKQLELMKGK